MKRGILVLGVLLVGYLALAHPGGNKTINQPNTFSPSDSNDTLIANFALPNDLKGRLQLTSDFQLYDAVKTANNQGQITSTANAILHSQAMLVQAFSDQRSDLFNAVIALNSTDPSTVRLRSFFAKAMAPNSKVTLSGNPTIRGIAVLPVTSEHKATFQMGNQTGDLAGQITSTQDVVATITSPNTQPLSITIISASTSYWAGNVVTDQLGSYWHISYVGVCDFTLPAAQNPCAG